MAAEERDREMTVQRRARILELIEREGQVQVATLSKAFRVSSVTIRNDLSHLEKKNLLIRTRGGAIRPQRVAVDFKITEKAQKHFKEKQAIGRKAAELIQEGDTIILDSGTTTQEIAKNLGHFKELTVITNALNIAHLLADYTNIRVLVPGGILRKNALSLVGPMAESAIKNYYCDKLFLGVDGIDARFGISTPNVEEAYLNRIMISVSREVYVVTDSSKFNKRSFAFIAPMEKINAVITDQNIPPQEREKLEKLGLQVILV
ncbi:transcriptional repressor AgaR [Calditrichota bacterium LG25]